MVPLVFGQRLFDDAERLNICTVCLFFFFVGFFPLKWTFSWSRLQLRTLKALKTC